MSEKLVVPSDGSVSLALQSFHQSASSSSSPLGRSFLVLTYANTNTLCVEQGVTDGFYEEAKSFFKGDNCRFVLLRTDHQVELAKTVKFVLIDWTPTTLSPMRRALLSTHKGQLLQLVQPVHVSFQISDEKDLAHLSEKEIMDKVEEAAGTKNNITKKEANVYQAVDISRSVNTATTTTSSAASASSASSTSSSVSVLDASSASTRAGLVPSSVTAVQSLSLANADELKQALATVRAAKEGHNNWVVLTYQEGSKSVLTLAGTGNGGVEELKNALNDERIYYGLFTVQEKIDKTIATRVCFFRLVPSKLPILKRSFSTTHQGFIQELFSPYSFDFDLSEANDLDLAVVMEKIGRLSGTKSQVVEDDRKITSPPPGSNSFPSTNKSSTSVGGGSSSAPMPSGELNITESLKDKFKQLKKDDNGLNYLIATANQKDSLDLLTSGEASSIEEVLSQTESTAINFIVYKVIDIIDQSRTTKFVLIRLQPESVPALRKSNVSTKIGLYLNFFSPYHVDFFISDKNELNQKAVMDKVQSASGSKNNVVTSK